MIKLDQVREYAPGTHPGGRFVVKARNVFTNNWIALDLCGGGSSHTYTEMEVFNVSIVTAIQAQQHWLDEDGRERTIIEPCDQVWVFGQRAWDWNTRFNDGSARRIGEKHILEQWTFVDPSAVTPAPKIIRDKCPLCGTRGYKSFNMFKCENPHCRNYAPTRP